MTNEEDNMEGKMTEKMTNEEDNMEGKMTEKMGTPTPTAIPVKPVTPVKTATPIKPVTPVKTSTVITTAGIPESTIVKVISDGDIRSELSVKIKLLNNAHEKAVPKYGTIDSAGCDLVASLGNEQPIHIHPGEYKLIPCGIAIEMPMEYEAQVRPRSGLALKHGITVLNSPGTIDSDYRGEIAVILINHGSEGFVVKSGDRIAQLVFNKVIQANWEVVLELSNTNRGSNGYGSTGTK